MASKTYRQIIMKYLFDRPGDTVYVNDILEGLSKEDVEKYELDTRKIADAIRRYKISYPTAGKDIKVIIAAHAWRYVPNAAATQAIRATNRAQRIGAGGTTKIVNGKPIPLTTSLRQYFFNNPGRVVDLSELVEMMSHDENNPINEQRITVGINNAKTSDREFKRGLETVVSGQAWRYVPPTDAASHVASPTTSATASTDVATDRPTPPPTSTATTDRATLGDVSARGDLLMLELVAETTDGELMVRDVDTKKIYRLLPL